MNRRDFLKAALLSPLGIPLLGQQGWAFRSEEDNTTRQKLIVILLRGAVDGLNVVVPYGDNHYKQLRPTIGLSRAAGLIDLDGYWGLHPGLAQLSPLWQSRSMAFVHACGSPDKTRSHFDAQDYMESGVPGHKAVNTGWMNRLVGQLPSKHSPLQAISLGPVLPRICAGPSNVATIEKSDGGGKNAHGKRGRHGQGETANAPVSKVFSDMYSGLEDDIGKAFASGHAARSKVDSIMAKAATESMSREQMVANGGALTPTASPEFGKQLATLITKDPSVQVAFIDFGGWDTHVRQGAEEGQLSNHLKPLSNGLADLVRGLGSQYKDTTIVVMSEFGRTAKENGNGGTDHGHGNAMWILGGGIAGGKVYGKWKGLADNQLNEGRDLPTTIDFRAVLSSLIGNNLRLSSKQLAAVFPEYQNTVNPFVQG